MGTAQDAWRWFAPVAFDMLSPVIFLWIEGPYADALRTQGYRVVTSEEEFRVLRRRRMYRAAPVVVLAEWAPHGTLSAFEGLRFISELFFAPQPVPPVLLCSFLDLDGLARRLAGQERRDVLRLQTAFARLPTSAARLADVARAARAPSAMMTAYARELLAPPDRPRVDGVAHVGAVELGRRGEGRGLLG